MNGRFTLWRRQLLRAAAELVESEDIYSGSGLEKHRDWRHPGSVGEYVQRFRLSQLCRHDLNRPRWITRGPTFKHAFHVGAPLTALSSPNLASAILILGNSLRKAVSKSFSFAAGVGRYILMTLWYLWFDWDFSQTAVKMSQNVTASSIVHYTFRILCLRRKI